MKKHLILTSLVAIATSTGSASAAGFEGVVAGDSVNFAGYVVETYTDSEGKTQTRFQEANVVKPELADYSWSNAGVDTTLTKEMMGYTTSNFKAAASFDTGTNKSLQAGQNLVMNNYTYEYDDKEYVLSVDKNGAFVANGTYSETVKVADVLDDASVVLEDDVHIANMNIVVTNGKSVEPIITVGKYVLVQNGTKLEDPSRPGEEVNVATGSSLETSFNNAKAAYTAVKGAISDSVTSTQAKVTAEAAAATTALADYTTDSTTLAGLNASYESLQTAKASYNHDSANYEQIQQAQEILSKPIMATVNEGVEEAKAYADAGDALTLQEAKAYADAGDALTLNKANAYTDSKVNTLEKNISGGVAAATALSSVAVSNVSKGEVSVGGGYGYYNNQSAMAFGAAMGLSDNWSVNAGAGIASGDKTQVTFRAGTNYKFKLF